MHQQALHQQACHQHRLRQAGDLPLQLLQGKVPVAAAPQYRQWQQGNALRCGGEVGLDAAPGGEGHEARLQLAQALAQHGLCGRDRALGVDATAGATGKGQAPCRGAASSSTGLPALALQPILLR